MLDGDDAFECVAPHVFRLTISNGEHIGIGTAFTVGIRHMTGQLILATARHTFTSPGPGALEWRISQFDDAGAITRVAKFDTDDIGTNAPIKWHKGHDVGYLIAPELDESGKPFANEMDSPLQVISPQLGASGGTAVAWCGYPAFVEDIVGHPQLCYFQGAVSCMVNTPERSGYLVDGHVAGGVSGGPVWHRREDGSIEIVGIVTAYAPEPDTPGLCVFEPVNPVVRSLGRRHADHPDGYDEFVVLNIGKRDVRN